MNMTSISIIIPIYNASLYIDRCLQSVEAQTLQDIEVILVDDHGQDDSMDKAKAFVAKSKRKDIYYVFLQTLKNSGPAVARNIGIKTAHGEYVAFLDADDWIEQEMYETLYANAKALKADLSCCNVFQDFDETGKRIVLNNPRMEEGVISDKQRKWFLCTFVAYFWSFIYRREWMLANDLLFTDAKNAEDSSFLACCMLAATRMAQTDVPYYHYVIHSGSLSQRKEWKGKEKRKAFGAMLNFAKRNNFLFKYWPQLMFVYIKKALIVPVVEIIK